MEEKYRSFMTQYGLISLLYVLKHFEQQQNFEECQLIYKVISEESELPTVIDKDSIDMVIDTYAGFGVQMDKERLLVKSKNYAKEFIDGKN